MKTFKRRFFVTIILFAIVNLSNFTFAQNKPAAPKLDPQVQRIAGLNAKFIVALIQDVAPDRFGQGTFKWSIPCEYNDNGTGMKFCVLTHYHVLDGKDGCTISKGGVSVTRSPVKGPDGKTTLQYK
jgi:hypothetical protein